MARYQIDMKPTAWKDLDDLPERDAKRVFSRIQKLADDLGGDVKKLRNYSPGYRLRVGDWRVLFDVEGSQVSVYRILNRRDAYD